MESLPRVVLERGRERPLLGRHPWVFSGAVRRVDGDPPDGAEVDVVTSDGDFVARGLFNSKSQIRVRLYRWEPGATLDRSFWASRIDAALRLRRRLPDPGGAPDAERLVFSEGDGLSGLVVDRYGEWLSIQVTSLALAARLDTLLDVLLEAVPSRGVLLRTEKGIGEREGLQLRDGPVRGVEPPGPVEVRVDGLAYRVDLRTGQKTGFYMDQRPNRLRAAAYAGDRRVADVCCYTGSFGLSLARAGARDVVGVDVSGPALDLARENAHLNGLTERLRFQRADAFAWLAEEAEAGRSYDLVVLDPPRFARSRRGVPEALRGYGRLNELAVRCLEPDGILVTFSCSGRVTRDDFAGVLSGVSERTGRPIQLVETLGQAPDHPVSATCPETAYLKGFVCRVE